MPGLEASAGGRNERLTETVVVLLRLMVGDASAVVDLLLQLGLKIAHDCRPRRIRRGSKGRIVAAGKEHHA